MKKLIKLIAVIAFFQTMIMPGTMSAKMSVKDLNYSRAWKTYASSSATQEPGKTFPYEECFYASAGEFDLPVTLLMALARGESDFNPKAESSKSCFGIMQIQWPGTAKDLGFTSKHQLYDACRNIRAGAKYLRYLLDRYDQDIHMALAAYNYGPGRIKKTMTSRSIPTGAAWYSGYVYYHLEQVLAAAEKQTSGTIKKAVYKPGSKLPVILFHSPHKARWFLEYFKERAPDLRLDWFRTSLGESYIVMLYDNSQEKEKGIQRLKKFGYYIDADQEF